MIRGLFNNTSIMEKALDGSWMKSQAISNNISNVDTPGYKKQSVNFESFLNNALDNKKLRGYMTDERHFEIGPQQFKNLTFRMEQNNKNSEMRIDENNVDIDEETTEFVKNNVYYNAVTQQTSKALGGLKTVITQIR